MQKNESNIYFKNSIALNVSQNKPILSTCTIIKAYIICIYIIYKPAYCKPK